ELDATEVLVEDFGARIKKAREAKKLTIEDLAKKLLEKKTLLSKIERQESKPDDKLIKKIEKELNIKLKEKVDYIKAVGAKKEGSMTLGDYIKKKKS
ncbi:MAG: helix-turn-helix domain-containing protein, partial [Thermoplasmata archaeon]